MELDILKKIKVLLGFKTQLSSVVGLEIASSALKIVGLRLSQKQSLDFYSMMKLPKDFDDDFVIKALKMALGDSGFPAKGRSVKTSTCSNAICILGNLRMAVRFCLERRAFLIAN